MSTPDKRLVLTHLVGRQKPLSQILGIAPPLAAEQDYQASIRVDGMWCRLDRVTKRAVMYMESV